MVNDGVEVVAIAKSRQRHLERIEAIEQVGAEAPLGDGPIEAGVGGRDQKDIDLGSDAANRTHGPVVEQAQKHGLQRDRHVADLVEEQCAAVGLLDQSDRAAAPRAGERALGIAEQFGLDQAFGQGGAIDGDEGAGASAGDVGVAGELLLAGTGLTADQDRHLARCRGLDLTDDGPHRRIAGDESGGRARQRYPGEAGVPASASFASSRRVRGLAAFIFGFQFLGGAIGCGWRRRACSTTMAPMPALLVARRDRNSRSEATAFSLLGHSIEGKRLQEAGRCTVGNATMVVPHSIQGALGGMKDDASTVEHDTFVVRP